MFFTYIINSVQTKRYYIGYSADLVKRLSQHNTGQNISTKKGIPWILIHSEEFETSADAWKRERQIKKYKGGKAFKLLIGEVAFSPRLINQPMADPPRAEVA